MTKSRISAAVSLFGIAVAFALTGCSTGPALSEEPVATQEVSAETARPSDSDALMYAQDFITMQCQPGGLWEAIGPLVVEGPMTGVNTFNRDFPDAQYPADDSHQTFNVYSNSKENVLFQLLLTSYDELTFRGLFQNPDAISMEMYGCLKKGESNVNSEIPYIP